MIDQPSPPQLITAHAINKYDNLTLACIWIINANCSTFEVKQRLVHPFSDILVKSPPKD